MRKSNLLKFIILGALGLILLVVWSRFFNLEEFKQSFASADKRMVLLAFLVFLSSFLLKGFRWTLILRQIIKIRFLEVFWVATASNLLNYIIPLRAGELAKIAYLKRSHDMDYGASASTILVDKLSDVSLLIWVPIITIWLGITLPVNIKNTLAILFGLFLVVSLILVIMVRTNSGKKNIFAKRAGGTIGNFITKFRDAIRTINLNPQKTATLFLISSMIAALEGLVVYLLFLAFSHHLPFGYSVLGALLRYLLFAIPMPPAQIGSVEIIWLSIYSGLYGIGADIVNPASLTAHSVSIISNIILGSFGMLISGIGIGRNLRKSQ